MEENKQKVDVVKRFVKDVTILLDKAEAFESENRADLMTILNQKYLEYSKKLEALQKVLSEMNIKKVIEESFGNKGNREQEHSIILEEGNQKSVNSYLIQKIHTLEDRMNSRFESEHEEIKALGIKLQNEVDRIEKMIKEKEIKREQQYREQKQMINDYLLMANNSRIIFEL